MAVIKRFKGEGWYYHPATRLAVHVRRGSTRWAESFVFMKWTNGRRDCFNMKKFKAFDFKKLPNEPWVRDVLNQLIEPLNIGYLERAKTRLDEWSRKDG